LAEVEEKVEHSEDEGPGRAELQRKIADGNAPSRLGLKNVARGRGKKKKNNNKLVGGQQQNRVCNLHCVIQRFQTGFGLVWFRNDSTPTEEAQVTSARRSKRREEGKFLGVSMPWRNVITQG
jgi:hypothetical protein